MCECTDQRRGEIESDLENMNTLKVIAVVTVSLVQWPEHVFHCHSSVTCLAFSANNPSHLAVGMFDGTIALYNIQFPDNRACFTSSR